MQLPADSGDSGNRYTNMVGWPLLFEVDQPKNQVYERQKLRHSLHPDRSKRAVPRHPEPGNESLGEGRYLQISDCGGSLCRGGGVDR